MNLSIKTEMHPLVSVVMPSLNQAAFMEVAVRSVLEQTYKNLELIVVDGLSTDGSIEILMRLQNEYGKRLKWISLKDNGPAQAINRAIAIAEGEIIGWLNSDDMYMPEAIAKAVSHFNRYPKFQMVYGEGQHIDALGSVLGRYPTLGPKTTLDGFENGSFICQPTVFMKRNALNMVGQLDEGLQLAFDFDLWLRFFKRYPSQIGMVRRIQACSRLHSACLTKRLRENVALEGMKVIQRHLGAVPGHWVLTHVDEMCASFPIESDNTSLIKKLESFLLKAKPYYKPDVWNNVLSRLKNDYRLGLSKPGLYASVQPDGWVSKRLEVKYRWRGKPVTAILLHCNALWPESGKLKLIIKLPNGDRRVVNLTPPDEFTLRFELPEYVIQMNEDLGGQICWTIETVNGFVPAQHDNNSSDKRKLAFKVFKLETETLMDLAEKDKADVL